MAPARRVGMRPSLLPWVAPVLLALAACKSTVTVFDGPLGGAAGGAAGGSGSSPSCVGPTPLCASECGSNVYVADADCIGGEWTCPPGSVDPADCPPSACWGTPLACEICGPQGWQCAPDEACIESCDGVVCAQCPAELDQWIVGACECSCTAEGGFSCDLVPGCCNSHLDCGDKYFVPCVEHVCKQPVAGKCWVDAECPDGEHCEGPSVCPCYYDCDGEDQPGECVPG